MEVFYNKSLKFIVKNKHLSIWKFKVNLMVNFLPTIFGFWLFRNFVVLTKKKIKLLFM